MNLGKEKNKNTVRVSKKDLVTLIVDAQKYLDANEAQARLIEELKSENAELLRELQELRAQQPVIIPIPAPAPEVHPDIGPVSPFRPNIYFDGRS